MVSSVQESGYPSNSIRFMRTIACWLRASLFPNNFPSLNHAAFDIDGFYTLVTKVKFPIPWMLAFRASAGTLSGFGQLVCHACGMTCSI